MMNFISYFYAKNDRKEVSYLAYLKQAKTEEEVKALTVAGVKREYKSLATDYNRLINLDYLYCPYCGDFKSVNGFYSSKKTKSGIEHFACKSCILDMCTDYDKKTKTRKDNRQKTIDTFRKLDWTFIDNDYKDQLQHLEDDVGVKRTATAVQRLITMVQSLPQYRGKTFADSDFGYDDVEADVENNPAEESRQNARIIKQGKKRFGKGWSNEEYMFLETEYQDWTKRYACENKAQELLFKRICFKELDIDKAQLAGKETKELDKTLQELMGSLSVKPSQSNSNSFTEAKTFGQLIAKWEEEKPIPEPDEDFKDVDKIGLYIDVFFKGHLSKMMGLKNAFSSLYERYIAKYTVKKPEYEEDSDTEAIFDQIFGSEIDKE